MNYCQAILSAMDRAYLIASTLMLGCPNTQVKLNCRVWLFSPNAPTACLGNL